MKMGARRLRLQRRQSTYSRMLSSQSDHKVQMRKTGGGYKCPGSYKR